MSFGFFGIQFGWGLQMANMSAIYQYLGAREERHRLALARRAAHRAAGPADHRLRQRPHLGRLGRRRPYFLAGADPRQPGADRHAEFAARSGWPPGCSGFWTPASISRMEPFRALRGRPAARRAAQERLCHAEPPHRPGRGAVLRAALHAHQLVRRQQRPGERA